MGLCQMFWAHGARFVTLTQTTLRAKPNMLMHNPQRTLLARAVHIRNYQSILSELGACTALHVELPQRPPRGPNLIDSESSKDGIMHKAREEQVGNLLHTRHYIDPCQNCKDPSAGAIPPGYEPTTIAGIPC